MDTIDKRILGIVAAGTLIVMVVALAVLRAEAIDVHDRAVGSNRVAAPLDRNHPENQAVPGTPTESIQQTESMDQPVAGPDRKRSPHID